MIRTNNPALKPGVFTGWSQNPGMELGSSGRAAALPRSTTMTLQGTVNATMILLSITTAFAVLTWWLIANHIEAALPVFIGSSIVGIITAIAICMRPANATWAAPLYAVTEGVFVGAISLVYARYAAGTKLGGATGTGIILQAGLLTFGITFALLMAYKSRLIKATENFKLGVVAATGGICLFHLVVIVMRLCGLQLPWLWDGGVISLAIAGFIVVVASLNLVLDFDFIEEGSNSGAPKHMEWYGAFGLLVTLVWLYVSLLRLLALLSRRD